MSGTIQVYEKTLGYAVATASTESAADELVAVSQRISGFNAWQTAFLAYRIAYDAPPSLYREVMDGAARDNQRDSFVQWLVAPLDDGSANGPAQAALQNVLEWHVSDMEKLQSNLTIQSTIDRGKESFKTGVKTAMYNKALSEKAEEGLLAVDDTAVYLSDPFDPFLARGSVGGYYEPGSNFVVIAAALTPMRRAQFNVSAIDESLHHELAHRAISTELESPDSYFWIAEEVGASQTAAVIGGGDPTTLNPARAPASGYVSEQSGRLVLGRQVPAKSYPEFCWAFDGLRHGPQGTANASLKTVAYSGTAAEKQAWENAVDAAWGAEGVVEKMRSSVGAFETAVDNNSRRTSAHTRRKRIAAHMGELLQDWREHGIPR